MKLGEVVLWAPASQGAQKTRHRWIVLTEPAAGSNIAVLINLTDRKGIAVPFPKLEVDSGYRPYITKNCVANVGDSFLCDSVQFQNAVNSGKATLLAPPQQLFDSLKLNQIGSSCIGHPAVPFDVEKEIKRFWRIE